MKKYRIAVCLCGQSRTWNYCKENIKNFYDNSFADSNNIEVDYFIHTWDINTWRYPNQHHHHFHDEPFTEYEDLCNFFNPKKFEIENHESFIEKRNVLYPNVQYITWESLYHSIKKCILLKRNYELENNFEYDIVIKARFDCFYNPKSRFVTQYTGALRAYTTHSISKMKKEFFANNFDEAIFFGDSKTMDLLSQVGDLHMEKKFDFLKNHDLYGDFLTEISYGPGAIMYENMIEMNIQPQVHHMPFNYYVARTTHLNSGLDIGNQKLASINSNFEESVKLHNDWYI
jgi:hypothetical protein